MQAGTPVVKLTPEYNASARTYTLKASQENKHASQPQLIPLSMGLLGKDGAPIALHLKVSKFQSGHEQFEDMDTKMSLRMERLLGSKQSARLGPHCPAPQGEQQAKWTWTWKLHRQTPLHPFPKLTPLQPPNTP